MKIKTKKVLAMLLLFTVLLSALTVNAFATVSPGGNSEKTKESTSVGFPNYEKRNVPKPKAGANYLALGDSIPFGYGLTNIETENFVSIIDEREGIVADNQGISGQTAAELKQAVVDDKKYDTGIAAAEFISITIGGNDAMAALYGSIAEEYNKENDIPIEDEDVPIIMANMADPRFSEIFTAATTIVNGEYTGATKATFTRVAVEVRNNIQSIIDYIRTKNADAKIYVTNQYNPYKGMTLLVIQIGAFFEAALTDEVGLNAAIGTLSDCSVVDIYSVFSMHNTAPGTVTNAKDSNLDFHPNKEGHALYAATLAEIAKKAETDDEAIERAKKLIVDGNVDVDYSKQTQTDKTKAVQEYINDILTKASPATGVKAIVTYHSGDTYTVELTKGAAKDSKNIKVLVKVASETDIEILARIKKMVTDGSVEIDFSTQLDIDTLAAVEQYVTEKIKGTGVVAKVNPGAGRTFRVLLTKGEANDSVDIDIDVRVNYKVLSGDNQKIPFGTEKPFIFKTEGLTDMFMNLYLNDILVDPSNYTVKPGSVIFTLNEEYVKTLPIDEYMLVVEFVDGITSINMEVVEADKTDVTDENNDLPMTGDDSNNLLMQMIMLVSLGGIGITAYGKKLQK